MDPKTPPPPPPDRAVWSYFNGACPHCSERAIIVHLLIPGKRELTCAKCHRDYEVVFTGILLFQVPSVCPICSREVYYSAPDRDLTFYVERSGPENLIAKFEVHPCEIQHRNRVLA